MSKQSSSLRLNDPYLAREKKKYTHPLPSREWIVHCLKQWEVPISYQELKKTLNIKRSEDQGFGFRIKAMIRDGQLYINRRKMICVAEQLDLVKCRVQGHVNGYGFAISLNKNRSDFYLSEKTMRPLMHGDIVMVRAVQTTAHIQREGRVLEILERHYRQLVARLYAADGVVLAVPEDKRLTQPILLPKEQAEKITAGEVVEIKIDHYASQVTLATGHVLERLGHYTDPGMEIEIAVRKYQLPYQFSAACLKEAETLPKKVLKKDLKHREDLRSLKLMTIDGENARDFDDAVYAKETERGFKLWVAIADVSHYVLPDSPLDREAYQRGTSVYFPRRVLPMLPEVLSNGLCSLLPHTDRLCLVCEMTISHSGMIEEYRFYEAVIYSQARLTYKEVQQVLSGEKKQHPLAQELTVLYRLYQRLDQARIKRGAIEFDSRQTRIEFDKANKIKRIYVEKRTQSHRLIEECMLVANVCAAKLIAQHKLPTLYRVHEGPNAEKLAILKEQLRFLGLTLNHEEKPNSRDYACLIRQLQGRVEQNLLETMLLRSMQQAVYQTENLGHFGLAYDAYVHFTSPIRRYPDLCVHRTIKAILHHQVYRSTWPWPQLSEQCSFTERRADEASRDVEKWLKTYYMREHLTEVFEGVITGVTNFGVFVMLNDVCIEGMIHISDLGLDYFTYLPEQLAVIGEKTKIRFSVGDTVIVKVVQADLETCRIDLTLVSGGKKSKIKPGSGKVTKKKTSTKRNIKDTVKNKYTK